MTAAIALRPATPGIPFARLVGVEWEKATDTRAARWLLAAAAASTVGLMLAPMLAPSSIDQTYSSYLGFAALALSILLPVVSILTLTSEWSQRTVLTTFTQEPRRIRVINAKVVVSLLLGVGAAVFGGAVTAFGLALTAASGRGLEADLTVATIVGFLLFVLVNVLAGVALGALVHSSAAAIAASFTLPAAFAVLGYASKPVAEWLDSSTTFNWLLEGAWGGPHAADRGLGHPVGRGPAGGRRRPHPAPRRHVSCQMRRSADRVRRRRLRVRGIPARSPGATVTSCTPVGTRYRHRRCCC